MKIDDDYSVVVGICGQTLKDGDDDGDGVGAVAKF